MSDLFTQAALINNKTKTQNGDIAFKSTTNSIADLFFVLGSSRKAPQKAVDLFELVYSQDSDLAAKMALYARDIRGGLGERALFRGFLEYLSKVNYGKMESILKAVPEIGRWDDLFSVFNTSIIHRRIAVQIIGDALASGNGLCAKWMPRKGEYANILRNELNLSPRSYRKLLVRLTQVVETQMCANEWESINLEHVPSVAMGRYSKAFIKHIPGEMEVYKKAVAKGEAKINTATLYPYDVVRTLVNGDIETAELQWKNMKEIMPEGTPSRILSVLDVSGSMAISVSGSITAMDVAVSLGIYLSERLPGVFNNKFITFSDTPAFVDLSNLNTLKAKYEKTVKSNWAMTTNIDKVFNVILNLATTNKLKEEDMPTHISIISDMQFNQASDKKGLSDRVAKMYRKAGYKLPTLIYWNVNGNKTFPTTISDETGLTVKLLSGFSIKAFIDVITRPEMAPEDYIRDIVSKYDKYLEA
jgi:hypothetical protein